MASYLGETIRSVQANLADGDEYIVIDGGSTDGSVEVIRQHEATIKHWISEPDSGYADALAKGFARATGDVQCWINAGDVLLKGTFEKVRPWFARGDTDLIFGDDFYIDEESRVISFSRGFVDDLSAAMLFGGWTPLQDACFWSRNLYSRVGGINPRLRYAADYDLFLRMARVGRTRHVPLAFSAFRRHRGQKSIVGADAYAQEREQVRRGEVITAGDGMIAAKLKRLYYLNVSRVRSRIAKQRWRRSDLEGRPISDFACAEYWPARNHGNISV